ncbi:hypothetical protein ACFQ14_09060 [Pseudahrensia aquimaris]|uniref:DUF4345 domain-containing protein n=1 Tax=Pseudahrensia aquimaris TaxID=744461 RepID=A0ABW3FDK2_9HYPH
MNFSLPSSSSETLAFLVLLIALAGGLITLFAPRMIMRWTGLALADGRAFGLSEIRGALGGFYVGVALYILLSEPRPYIILTFAFGFFCFGRILAFVVDRVHNPQHMGAIMGDAILATIPAMHTFGGFSFLEAILGW